jgi:spermidine synthase
LLQATDFEHELATASILYLTGDTEVRVVVLENQDYRFLVINGSMQSVLCKADPGRVVFPHQQAMLEDLDSLAPGARVLELGLGGGSALRHASYEHPGLRWTCVESRADVINLYWEYFAPAEPLGEHELVLDSSLHWLQRAPRAQQFELILCDVYAEIQVALMDGCLDRLAPGGILVVNWLPHLQPQGDDSQDFFGWFSSERGLSHRLQKVPGFRNQIHRLTRT